MTALPQQMNGGRKINSLREGNNPRTFPTSAVEESSFVNAKEKAETLPARNVKWMIHCSFLLSYNSTETNLQPISSIPDDIKNQLRALDAGIPAIVLKVCIPALITLLVMNIPWI